MVTSHCVLQQLSLGERSVMLCSDDLSEPAVCFGIEALNGAFYRQDSVTTQVECKLLHFSTDASRPASGDDGSARDCAA